MNNSLKFFSLMLIFMMGAYAEDWAVIVNKSNGASSISKAELKRIYTGKMTEWSGNKVVAINLPESDATANAFIDGVVKKSYAEYKSFWVEQQIKGAGSAPMEQKTAAAVKLMVSEIPGAIGYIPKGEVDDSVKEIQVN